MDKLTKQQIDTFNDIVDSYKRAIPTDHPGICDDLMDDLKMFHEFNVRNAYMDGRLMALKERAEELA